MPVPLIALALGAGALYLASRSTGPSASKRPLPEGDASLIVKFNAGGQERLAYKPEARTGLLNALLTKAVIPNPEHLTDPNFAMAQLVETGQVLAASQGNAYLFAKAMHDNPGQPWIWVTPTLTSGGKETRFLWWGDAPPPAGGTLMALLVGKGEPWPGKPAMEIPISPGAPPGTAGNEPAASDGVAGLANPNRSPARPRPAHVSASTLIVPPRD